MAKNFSIDDGAGHNKILGENCYVCLLSVSFKSGTNSLPEQCAKSIVREMCWFQVLTQS